MLIRKLEFLAATTNKWSTLFQLCLDLSWTPLNALWKGSFSRFATVYLLTQWNEPFAFTPCSRVFCSLLIRCGEPEVLFCQMHKEAQDAVPACHMQTVPLQDSIGYRGTGRRGQVLSFYSQNDVQGYCSIEHWIELSHLRIFTLASLSKALAKGYSLVPVLPSRRKKGYSIFTLLQMCQEQDIHCSLFFPGFSYPFQSSYKAYSLFPRIKSFPSREETS